MDSFQFPLLGSPDGTEENPTVLAPFNSLYWVLPRIPCLFAVCREHLSIPFIGFATCSRRKRSSHELAFQFPLLGSIT